MNHLKQMGLALNLHHDTYGRMPSGCELGLQRLREQRFYWSGQILDFLEQQPLRASLEPSQPWQSIGSANAKACATYLSFYRCPSANVLERWEHDIPGRVPSTYLACASGLTARESGNGLLLNGLVSDGVFYTNSRTRLRDLTDGASNTLMVGEALVDQFITGPDATGTFQLIDHWYIGSPGMGDNEMSEALGSTAAPINSLFNPKPISKIRNLGTQAVTQGGARPSWQMDMCGFSNSESIATHGAPWELVRMAKSHRPIGSTQKSW